MKEKIEKKLKDQERDRRIKKMQKEREERYLKEEQLKIEIDEYNKEFPKSNVPKYKLIE